jgi:hypothetical protein
MLVVIKNDKEISHLLNGKMTTYLSYLPEDLKREIAHADHTNKLHQVHDELLGMTYRLLDYEDPWLYGSLKYCVTVIDIYDSKHPKFVGWNICVRKPKSPVCKAHWHYRGIIYCASSIRHAKKLMEVLKQKRSKGEKVKTKRQAKELLHELFYKGTVTRTQPPRKCKKLERY